MGTTFRIGGCVLDANFPFCFYERNPELTLLILLVITCCVGLLLLKKLL